MNNNVLERFGPYLVVASFVAIIFGFYATIPQLEIQGIIGFALVGFLWALFIGFLAEHLMDHRLLLNNRGT